MDTDQAEAPELRLKFPAGRFEQQIVGAIVLVQIVFGLMAALVGGFWAWLVLGSLYNPWHWYPGVFTLAVATAIPVVVLHYLYE